MASFDFKQIGDVVDSLVANNYTASEVQQLRGALGDIKPLLNGTAKIVRIERKWHEKDGVIRFTLTSNGLTGDEWIKRLEKQGNHVSDYAKQILLSPEFKSTNGVTYEVAVLKGILFSDNERITKNIRTKAASLGQEAPNAELACLIREAFSDEDLEAMGLVWIVCMHNPIKDADGVPSLLDVRRDGVGRWLSADCGNPGRRWDRYYGFAFVAPQVGSQN